MSCLHEYEERNGMSACKYCPRVVRYDHTTRTVVVIVEGE